MGTVSILKKRASLAFQSSLGIKRNHEGRDQASLNHTKGSISHASDWAAQTPSRTRMSSTLGTHCKGMFWGLWWAQETILCGLKDQEVKERMFILPSSDTCGRSSVFCGSCKSNKIFMFSVPHPFPQMIKKPSCTSLLPGSFNLLAKSI